MKSKVKYIYYTQEDYDEPKSTLDAKTPIQAVQGTFKIHYIVAINPMQIYTRNVSCYCQQCIDDVAQSNCEGYTNHCLTMREKKNKDQIDPNQQDKSKENENAQKKMEHINENVDDNDKQQPLERNKVNVEENDWIAVVYSGKWYVGQVMEIDNEDGEYFVDFLENYRQNSEQI